MLEKVAAKNAELQKAIAEGKDEETIKSLQTELTLFQLLSDAYSTMTSDYTEMKDAMSKATDVQKTLGEIFDASQSGAALTSEQIQDVILAFRDLEGFNLSRLFNITSDGVRLNADAYKEYNKQLREYTKLQLESQIASEQANLDRMERSGVPESDIKSQQEKIAMLQLQAGIYDAANDSLTEYTNALERAQTAQTNLNDALETSLSSGGLSVEQIKNVYNAYKDLDGFDPANLFIATAYGVKLNTKEMKKLNDEMERQTESELLKQISSASTGQEKSYWTAMYQAYQATRSDYALMAKDLDRAANAQNNLNDAFEASQSVTGMNAEQIENVLSAFMDLNGFDAKGLFEMTATGVRMNTEAFKAYNEQLQQNTKLQFQNQIKSKKNEIDKVLGGAQSEKSLSVLQNELFQLQLLASVYDGLTLLERRQKLLELQQKAIKSAESEKKALVVLVQDGISAQVKAMDELIDKYKDSLESAKDLYDYQKKVSKQTKNIAEIEKQLSAYEGNTSEETRATVQKLKQELQDAQEDLQETEYKQYISDQKRLLDDLKSEYEETLNSGLDDVDGLIRDLIDYTNNNSAVISETILAATNDVGYTMSDAVRKIWSREDMSLDGVITNYGNDFGSKLTSTNNILGGIYATICAMAESSNGVIGGSYNAINAATLGQIASSFASLYPQFTHSQSYTGIGNVGIPIAGINDYSDKISLLRENQNINYTVNVDVGGVTIPIDHVADYEDFVRKMQRDKQFEEMIQSMTVNRLGGGSKFDKHKYYLSK